MLKLPNEMNNMVLNERSFVSDGKYLYLHTSRGLLKIGSGHGGTIWGHIYIHNADFYPTEIGWLGYANVGCISMYEQYIYKYNMLLIQSLICRIRCILSARLESKVNY